MSVGFSDDATAFLASNDTRLVRELSQDEELLWAGFPIPGMLARKHLPISIMGLFFGGFALFWIVMASGITRSSNAGGGGITSALGLVFPLFGVPFLLIGLAMIMSPVFTLITAKKGLYALTNRRCIVWTPKLFGSMQISSYTSDDMGDMARTENGKGEGDLVFKTEVSSYRDSDGDRRAREIPHGFLAIRDVAEVEKLVRAVLVEA